MSIAVRAIDLRIVNMRLRLPFRYGIVTVRAFPHLLVRAEVEADGVVAAGYAADHLPPKWFTKDPASHYRDDLADMIACIASARDRALASGAAASPFEWWQRLYAAQKAWAAGTKHPPLLWNFGVSLMERAALDGFLRATRTTLERALRCDVLGIDLRLLVGDDDAGEARVADLLPARPLRRIVARHTVGLVDPLTDADVAPGERVDDGLPQTLEDAIRAYGLKHFKIKLAGDVAQDAQRLRRLADLIVRLAPADFAFTLDANENFKEVEAFRELWQGLSADASLRPFLARLIFVEQPLHRDVALSADVGRALARWPDRPPMIIDESDGDLESLPRALACGYDGTSHKNCKGVFKGLASACRIELRRRADPRGRYLLSGEDLCNVGPVALLQDLAVAANLGISTVERNGHHYLRGLSAFDEAVQQKVLASHGDLYAAHPGGGGFATLDIRAGELKLDSVLAAPMGVAFDLDLEGLQRLEEWNYESLGIE